MTRFTPACILALALLPCVALAGPDPVQEKPSLGFDEECGCGKANVLRQRFLAGLPVSDEGCGGTQPPGYTPREALTDTDVLHNNLDIEVDPTTGNISGSNTMTVKSLVDGLTQFTFMLRSQYVVNTTGAVNSVQLNGTASATATTPGTNSYARTVTLDRPYNTGEVFTLKVAYSGVAVSRGFGSIDITTQGGVNGAPPIVETLSEAYFSGTWWPCKDGDFALPGDNSDKSTMEMAVTAPSTMRTVSNGLLQGIDPVAGGKSRYRWATNYPTSTYLFCICSTPYNTYDTTYTYPLPGGGTGTMPVEFNLYPSSDTAAHRAVWALCTDMMAAYRPFYGEYPFVNEKYGIYQFNFSGGQEHQTNTGEGVFDETVTSHELGHQWWGDNVTCKTWSDIWLNEGFATYTECLWLEHKPGSAGLSAYLAGMQARKPNPTNDSVYVYDTSDMNRIFSTNYTYRKGAWALHQLRHVVGDTTFYQILQAYRSAFQGSAATTDDFAGVASSIYGQDLTPFFQEWVYGIGAPAYTVGAQAATVNGQNYVKVSLTQTQDATWPGGAAPAGYFSMPIDLRVNTAGGNSTSTLNNKARTQWFVIPANNPMTSVALDEFGWVLTSTATTSGSYQNGPPKIVQAVPAPGSTLDHIGPGATVIYFSEPVNAPSSAFSITGPGGSVPFTYNYDPSLMMSQLTWNQHPLPPGAYTVHVAPTVASSAAGIALDGEVPGTALAGQGVFPSGDGVAGGGASWTFTLTQQCGTADFNGDGDLGTDADIQAFFACLGGSCCPTCYSGGADFDGDGDVGTDLDIESFFRVLAGGPC